MFERQQTRRRAVTLVVICACLLWAGLYVHEAAGDPFGGDETALFIQPLFYLLLAVGAWAGVEAGFGRQEAGSSPVTGPTSSDDHNRFGASGLADFRRLALVLSFPLMLLLISLLGFVISSALYVSVLTLGLGERRSGVITLLALLSVTVVWLFFGTLLGVPLDLWPAGFN